MKLLFIHSSSLWSLLLWFMTYKTKENLTESAKREKKGIINISRYRIASKLISEPDKHTLTHTGTHAVKVSDLQLCRWANTAPLISNQWAPVFCNTAHQCTTHTHTHTHIKALPLIHHIQNTALSYDSLSNNSSASSVTRRAAHRGRFWGTAEAPLHPNIHKSAHMSF